MFSSVQKTACSARFAIPRMACRILLLLLALGAAPAARAQVAVLSDVWWSNEADANSDGYKESATLNIDSDAVGGSQVLNVYEKVYYRSSSGGTWNLIRTTGVRMVVDGDPDDFVSTGISLTTRDSYDFKVEVYRSGSSTPDDYWYIYSYKMGTTGGANDRVAFWDAWWTNAVDADSDGYKESARLNWDVDIALGSTVQSVYEKLYYRVTGTGTWTLFWTTPVHDVIGWDGADAQYMDIVPDQRNIMDFKIEVFRAGQTTRDDYVDPYNDPDLSAYKLGPIPGANDRVTLQDAYWGNVVDDDSDEYAESARLYFNVDVSAGSNTQVVYEKIYYRVNGTTTWNLLNTQTTHTVTGTLTSDRSFIDISNFGTNSYDFRIEVFRQNHTPYDASLDPGTDLDLLDFKLEVRATTGDLVTIFDSWWTNQADYNGDSYLRSATLNWNPDIYIGAEMQTVFEKIYRKRHSSSTWTLLGTTANHTISNSEPEDTQTFNITGDTHDNWDFKIEIYRAGQTLADYQIDPGNDMDLDQFRMETPAEDDPNLVVATPSFSPDPAVTYYDPQGITLSCATPSVAIRYTLTTDGSTPADPTPASDLYSGTPIPITFGINKIKAKAWKVGAVAVPSEVNSATYTIAHDMISPNALIERMDPNPPGTSSVRYRVTFSEPVTGVDTGDFYLYADGTLGGVGIVSLTGGPTTFTATIATGTGDGILRLDLKDEEGGVTIQDLHGNSFTGGAAGQEYWIDRTAPGFAGVTASPASAKLAAIVTLSFTASEALQTSPTVTVNGNPATLISKTVLDYAAQYTIRITDLDGPVPVSISGTDLAGNPGSFNSTSVLRVDKTSPPAPGSLALDSADDSGVSNSDRITNLSTGLTLRGTAEANSIVQLWDGSTRLTSGTAAAFGGAGIDIALTEGLHSVTAIATDAAGNASPASAALSIRVDQTAPNPGTATPPAYAITNPFRVNYSGAGDGGSGLRHVELWSRFESASWVDSTLRSTTASGGFDFPPAGPGSYAFFLVAEDLAGNRSAAATGAGSSPTIYDGTPPQVLSIDRLDATPTSATTVRFTITFSEPVSGVDTGDFSFFTVGGLSGVLAAGLTGGPSVYTVILSSGSGEGLLRLDLNASGTGITDTAGNPVSGGYTSGQVYRIDKVAPVFSALTATPSAGRLGAMITLRFTASETLATTPTLTVNNNPVAPLTLAGLTYTGIYMVLPTDPDGAVIVSINGVDLVGHAGSLSSTTALRIDKIAPAAPTLALAAADDTGVSNSDGITRNNTGLTFQGTAEGGSTVELWDGAARVTTGTAVAFGIPGIDASLGQGSHTITAIVVDLAGNASPPSPPVSLLVDMTAPGAGMASSPAVTTVSPVHVTAAGYGDSGSGLRHLELWFKKDTGAWQDSGLRATGAGAAFDFAPPGPGTYAFGLIAEDIAGNRSAAPSGSGDTQTAFDATAPTVFSITRLDGNPTSITSVRFAVTFSEPVSGVDANDFAPFTSGTLSGAQVTGITGGPTVYTVTADTGPGNGELGLSIDAAGSGIQDPMGNVMTADFNGGQRYRIDRVGPTFSGVNAAPTPARTGVQVVIAFSASEALKTSPTLTLNGTAVPIKTHSGFNYTCQVAIKSTDPDGAATIAIAGYDRAGNRGTFSSGGLLEIDKTAPAAPSGLGLDAADDSGVSNSDRVTNHISDLTVRGTAEAGSRVKLWAGSTLLTSGTAAAFASPGLSFGRPQGTYNVLATATDPAGNVSPASAPLVVKVDTAVPVLSGPTAAPALAGAGGTVTIGFTVSEALGTSPTVTVNGHAATVTARTGMVYSAQYAVTPADADGIATVIATGLDVAGNTGSLTQRTMLRIDQQAPVSAALNTSGRSSSRQLIIRWSATDPQSNGYASGVKTIDLYWSRNGGAWQKLGSYPSSTAYTYFDLPDHGTYGQYSFHTVAQDQAGNIEGAPARADWSYIWLDPANAAAGPEWKEYE